MPGAPGACGAQQPAHFWAHGRIRLATYLALELKKQEWEAVENEYFVKLVPLYAVWSFDTPVLPRRRVPNLIQQTSPKRDALADAPRRLMPCHPSRQLVSQALSVLSRPAPAPHPNGGWSCFYRHHSVVARPELGFSPDPQLTPAPKQ